MKIKNIIFPLLLVLLASCSHDTLPTYEDVNRIYFAFAANQGSTDEVKINLGYDTPLKSDSTIGIQVRLLGHLSDTDRPLSAELIAGESSAVQGTDIEILPSVMHAGNAIDVLKIKLKNSEKIETKTLLARIRLLPNAHFHVDTETFAGSSKNSLEYNIYFDAKTDMPNLWADVSAGMQLTGYFGKYSNVKFTTICEVCGVTRDYFMYDPSSEDALAVLNKRMPTSIANGMISQVNRYLKAYQDAHNGETLKDENGEEVKMALNII
jgi:hypothetical protein